MKSNRPKQEILFYASPQILDEYKCLVCQNQTVVKGFDPNIHDYVYISKLTKIQIGLHWIFFCPSCLYELKNEVRKL